MLRLTGAPRYINFARPALGAQSDEKTRIDGQHTGTAPPFPLWRLRSSPYRPPVDQIREWYRPQARIAGRLTIQPLDQFPPHCGFLSAGCTLSSGVARLLHTAG
jgi:hypothetical protein